MKKLLSVLLTVVILSAMFVSCTSDDYYVRPKRKQTSKKVEQDVNPVMVDIADIEPNADDSAKEAFATFNLKLFNALNEKDKNLFFSAMSISSALTMAYFGAEGTTKDEIHDALSYSDMSFKNIASAQKAILDSYIDTGDTVFNVANSIWVDDTCQVRDSYVETIGSVFDTSANNIDLQGKKAVDTINDWVSRKTNGMIPEFLIKSQNPLENTLLLLINAIYFNGTWSEPFESSDTFKKEFRGATSNNVVSMMSSQKNVLGYDGEGYKAIFLPYGEDKRFYMIVVLPDDDIEDFIEDQTFESWYSILSTFKEQKNVIYQIPKFEMEETVKLNNTLKSLGMTKAFESDADFSNMAYDKLQISNVLHKAKIKVDELGTEAAAVTGVGVDGCAMEQPTYDFEFCADKPFLYFIVDSKEQIVLFTGKLCDLN
jgi:serpin B